jgi:hypothetical protein
VLSSTNACAQSKKEIAEEKITENKFTKLSITLEETRELIPDILALDLRWM